MAEYLFLHGKIVVDNTRLYEDGAILADEERVLDIFPHASKIKENIKAYKVNLEGRIILPFFEDCIISKNNKLSQYKTTS